MIVRITYSREDQHLVQGMVGSSAICLFFRAYDVY